MQTCSTQGHIILTFKHGFVMNRTICQLKSCGCITYAIPVGRTCAMHFHLSSFGKKFAYLVIMIWLLKELERILKLILKVYWHWKQICLTLIILLLRILKIIQAPQKICFRKFICLNDNIDHGTEEAKTVSVYCCVSCCVNSLNHYHFSPEVLDLE